MSPSPGKMLKKYVGLAAGAFSRQAICLYDFKEIPTRDFTTARFQLYIMHGSLESASAYLGGLLSQTLDLEKGKLTRHDNLEPRAFPFYLYVNPLEQEAFYFELYSSLEKLLERNEHED